MVFVVVVLFGMTVWFLLSDWSLRVLNVLVWEDGRGREGEIGMRWEKSQGKDAIGTRKDQERLGVPRRKSREG